LNTRQSVESILQLRYGLKLEITYSAIATTQVPTSWNALLTRRNYLSN
jgi:hypothetical protein